VKESWYTLAVKASDDLLILPSHFPNSPMHSTRSYYEQDHVNQMSNWGKYHKKNVEKPTDKFFSIPMLFKSKDVAPPAGKTDWDFDVITAFDKGWMDINCVLCSVPYADKHDCVQLVELNEVLGWLEHNHLLVKPTDKNLMTALIVAIEVGEVSKKT
jgi:hypothetical protein